VKSRKLELELRHRQFATCRKEGWSWRAGGLKAQGWVPKGERRGREREGFLVRDEKKIVSM